MKTTSFSRLSLYNQCSEMYKQKYIVKGNDWKSETSEALLVGSLTHYLLESALADSSITSIDAFYLVLPEFLKELDLYDELKDCTNELVSLCVELSHFFYRASSRCVSPNKIRTKAGELPKDIVNFPPRQVQEELNEKDLKNYIAEFNQIAGRKRNLFITVNFTWMLSKALFFARYFKIPASIVETLHIELGFSTNDNNKVPWVGDTFMKGFIDWIVKFDGGAIGIIDHKTSKEQPDVYQISNHPQLNIYAYVYNYIYGKYPEYIGINHLPSGNLIIAELDLNTVNETVKYYKQVQMMIDANIFLRHHPNEYNVPCFKKDWRTKEIIYVCPALKNCWSIYAETLPVASNLI